jgi:hypothetical protein
MEIARENVQSAGILIEITHVQVQQCAKCGKMRVLSLEEGL